MFNKHIINIKDKKLLYFLSSLLYCISGLTHAEVSSFFLDIKQMDRYGYQTRKNSLDSICQSKEEHNLVILNAISNGHLNNNLLDEVQPYYKCFQNIFFSVNSKKWKRHSKDWKDSKYYNGIMNRDFSNKNISYALNNAKKIKNKYPKMKFGWYIHYEANLNYLINTKVKNSYKYYLKNVSNSLYEVKATDILWSPAFWTPNSKISDKKKLTDNLNDYSKAHLTLHGYTFKIF